MPILENLAGMFGFNQPRPRATPFKEQGVAGVQVYGGWIMDREKKASLTYLQRNNTYEEIMSNIAVAGAAVRYFTALATTAQWSVKEAEDDTNREYAEIVEKMMTKMDNPWSAVIKHALMAKFFGFSVQEWTAFRDEKEGTIFFRSIENRPQRTIEQFDIDATGQVVGFGQRAPMSGERLYIPRSKTFYMIDDLLSDSPAGQGVLRHIAETCDRLQNYMDLEKQGFEKDLRNIPIGRVPYTELNIAVANGEITEAQAKAAISQMENIVKLSRKQNSTGLLLDSKPYISKTDTAMNVSTTPQWDLALLEGQGSTNGLTDIAKAIERLQVEVARVIGTEAMMLSGGGSQALSQDKSRNLYLLINSALADVKFQANKDLIDSLWQLNGFPDEMKPELAVEDVNAKDAGEVATVLRDMATAGAPISPDDEVVNDVRNLLGVSRVDLEQAAMLLEEQQQREMEMHEMSAATTEAQIKATEAKARQTK